MFCVLTPSLVSLLKQHFNCWLITSGAVASQAVWLMGRKSTADLITLFVGGGFQREAEAGRVGRGPEAKPEHIKRA